MFQYIYPKIYKNISKAERSNLMLSGSNFSCRLDVEKTITLAQEKFGNKILFLFLKSTNLEQRLQFFWFHKVNS